MNLNAYKNILEHIQEGVLVLDLNLKIKIMNSYFKKLFSINNLEIEKLTDIFELKLFDLNSELGRYLVSIKTCKTFDSRDALDYFIIHNQKISVRIIYYEENKEIQLYFQKIQDENYLKENPGNKISYIEDILNTTSNDIINNEYLFRRLFEDSPISVAIVSLDFKFIMVNKALCNFLGYSEEELKLKSLSEVTHPDDIETSRLEGEKLYTKQKIQIEIEKRYIHSDGSIKWGKLHAKLIFNSEGKPIYFIPIIQDITKRKESELKEKDSKEMLESIIDNIPEIIFLKDSKDLSFKLFNKAGESFLKKKRDELIGKTDYDLFEKQIAEKLTSKDRVVLEKKGEIDTHEEVVSTPFGNRIMRTKKLALLDENKKPKYLLGIAKDITEEKLINTEIKILKEVADLAGKAKSEFLTNISHELRTPLNGIIGLAETLSSANLPDELSNHAKTIFQSANSLLEMYNNILNYTSQEEKNAVLNFEKIQIIDIFSKAKANIQFLANKKRIKVKTIINPQDLSFFFSDKVRLNQIFLNLLNNAIHYTQKGEIEIKAEVLEKSFQDGNYKIRFSVKDTGTGISKEELKSIQEDIDGNSAKEKFNGSEGLGLVVTNRILSNLNSKLEIESEEGKGSLFYFDLIVNSENKVKSFVKPIVKIDEKIKERNKENFKWKILLVDDDDINLYVIMELLKLILSNVEFLIAKNGKSAIEQFQQNSPDIIFMDVQMPIKNGYEATEEIRKIEKEPKVPIIAITAGTISGDREKCLSSGMNDYAGKPIRKEILNEILDKWLLKEPI